ncbi:MAG TPA: hypothetical protein VF107_12140 [Burkholderiaceae bacterium]
MRISDQPLFIPDLGNDYRPDASNKRCDNGSVTTMAVGEEGGGEVTSAALGEESGGEVTSAALGEEGGGDVTSAALGEEGGGDVTSAALGEEGGDVTTMALGEEGCAGADLGSGPTQLEKLLDLFVRELGR